MSERYTRVYTQKENLYAMGSPVIIQAGVLLKDNQTDNILAQLKYKNIQRNTIKAMKIQLFPYDTMGNVIGTPVEFHYLDLSAGINTVFGSRIPVPMPDPITRAFSVRVVSVAFEDNTVWTADNTPWEPLPVQPRFGDSNSKELLKQYKLEYGSSAEYYLLETKDLWFCVCGGANNPGDDRCILCGKTLSVLRQFDVEKLKLNCDERLRSEKAEAKKIEQKRRKEAAKRKTIICIVLGMVCLGAITVPAWKQIRIINDKYNIAVSLMEAKRYHEAITAFEELDWYRRSKAKIDECNNAILDNTYNSAILLMEKGQYAEAIAVFENLEGYKDCVEQIEKCLSEQYNEAISLMEEKMYTSAITAFKILDGYKDSKTQIENCKGFIKQLSHINKMHISAGDDHTVGLKSDGTVVAVGYNRRGQCDTTEWSNIVAVSAGYSHTIGLKSDGTVVVAGSYDLGEYDTTDWSNIVAVSAGHSHIVGLKSDGTVVSVGYGVSGKGDTTDWSNIVAVSAGYSHTVGLKSDGTVIVAGYNVGEKGDTTDWSNIVAVSAGEFHTVGLKRNGTVVAVGTNSDGQCDTTDWSNIVAVSAGHSHTVGLKSDGTVVAVGYNRWGQCDTTDWSNIVAVSAGYSHTIGLKSDGTVVVAGDNYTEKCDTTNWFDIRILTEEQK